MNKLLLNDYHCQKIYDNSNENILKNQLNISGIAGLDHFGDS